MYKIKKYEGGIGNINIKTAKKESREQVITYYLFMILFCF